MDEQLTKEGIRAVCVKAVVDVSGSIPQDVRDESHFVNDLWMDDLDVVEAIIHIESALGVLIPGSDDAFKTFGELVTAACKEKGVEA
jgi:acyl carrier protein